MVDSGRGCRLDDSRWRAVLFGLWALTITNTSPRRACVARDEPQMWRPVSINARPSGNFMVLGWIFSMRAISSECDSQAVIASATVTGHENPGLETLLKNRDRFHGGLNGRLGASDRTDSFEDHRTQVRMRIIGCDPAPDRV